MGNDNVILPREEKIWPENEKRLKVDGHCHTTGSDGSYTIAALIAKAKENGLKYLAITDHNHLAHLAQFLVKNGRPLDQAIYDFDGVKLIPGVEVTCRIKNTKNLKGNTCKVHIVVLAPDLRPNTPLVRLINAKHKNDIACDYGTLISILKAKGIEMDESMEEKVRRFMDYKKRQYPGFSSLDRESTYEFLMSEGLVRSRKDYAKLYDKVHKASRMNITTADLIKIVHASGGIAILAHPKSSITRRTNDPETAYEALINDGIDGFETQCYGTDFDTNRTIEGVARRMGCENLLCSGGSDCHGPSREVGMAKGNPILEDNFRPLYERIEEKQRQREVSPVEYPDYEKADIEKILKYYEWWQQNGFAFNGDLPLFYVPYPEVDNESHQENSSDDGKSTR